MSGKHVGDSSDHTGQGLHLWYCRADDEAGPPEHDDDRAPGESAAGCESKKSLESAGFVQRRMGVLAALKSTELTVMTRTMYRC